MVKYVKCIDNEYVEKHLTLGKTYEVIADYGGMYELVSDIYVKDRLYKYRFIEVNTQKIHELWA